MVTPHCSSDACRQGKGPCPTPEACGVIIVAQPCSAPAPRVTRDPMPIPTNFGIEGPFFAAKLKAWWIRAGMGFAIFVLACFAAGALLRHHGVI